MSTRIDLRKPFMIVLTASFLAWLGLWLWGNSSGRFLHHEEIEPAARWVASSFSWPAGLMTVGMMLPTSLPLVALFHGLTRQRSDQPVLVALLLAGYLGVWTLFGGLAHPGDRRLHEVVHALPWLEERA